MKRTLLEMVQDILSDIDSDEVNSIDDTIESQQVATIIKNTYLAWMSRSDWPHLRKLIQLNASNDPSRPTHMSLPRGVKELLWVRYLNEGSLNPAYIDVKFAYPEDFVRLVNTDNSRSELSQRVTDSTGIQFSVNRLQQPHRYTSFDDQTLVFDGYDSRLDDTLQARKVQALAYMSPGWSMVDDFVPDLPSEMFAGLYNESLSIAANRIAQKADQKAEQESRRQQYWAKRRARVSDGIKDVNYGRPRRK